MVAGLLMKIVKVGEHLFPESLRRQARDGGICALGRT
jgi:hypothetical protein